jgi:hypothetical protein
MGVGMWVFIPEDKLDLSLSRRVIKVYILGKVLVALNIAFLYPLFYIFFGRILNVVYVAFLYLLGYIR